MNTSENIIKELSSPPTRQCDELPVITHNNTLPFNKLSWSDFEKFCFQLGSKSMECLETAYIYGRNGQKQYGIDLYFHKTGVNKVWQIKKYTTFNKSNIAEAVHTFLKGKWVDKTTEFTLCISNYLDDTGVVDEIDKQSAILEERGITFSVLNSEKLTIKAKAFPDLIETFFGEHWLTALGISKKQEIPSHFQWQTDSGKILDSQQIYHKGNFNMQFNGNQIYLDMQLPDGCNTHTVLNAEKGSACIQTYPYPLEEYKIDIPKKLITSLDEGMTTISGKRYYVKQYHLKWGKNATFLFDSHDHEKLIDTYIDTRTFINHTHKIISILDPAEQAVEL